MLQLYISTIKKDNSVQNENANESGTPFLMVNSFQFWFPHRSCNTYSKKPIVFGDINYMLLVEIKDLRWKLSESIKESLDISHDKHEDTHAVQIWHCGYILNITACYMKDMHKKHWFVLMHGQFQPSPTLTFPSSCPHPAPPLCTGQPT